jgi:hypothetical protein
MDSYFNSVSYNPYSPLKAWQSVTVHRVATTGSPTPGYPNAQAALTLSTDMLAGAQY